MSLKLKILLLAILPLIVLTASVTWVTQHQSQLLAEQEIETFEKNLMENKREELRHYVDLAVSAVQHVLNTTDPGDKAAQEEIKRILSELRYGDDGYFFAYTKEGINLVHPIQPELVGQNLFDIQDINGIFLIRGLLEQANRGGGYYRYLWRKPSEGNEEDKLSYVITLPEHGWMIGTGVYVDDIVQQVEEARSQVDLNVRNTFFTVIMMLATAVTVISLIAVAINVHATQLANDRLREVVHKYVQFQINQRRNFARELHDGINQLMVSIKFRIELASEQLTNKPEEAQQHLGKAGDVINQAIREVRRISHDLRPSLLDDLGFEPALLSMTDEFSERTGIFTNVRLDLPDMQLPDDIEITIYRVIQEALTNVERHSEATEASISIYSRDDTIKTIISDNGKGVSRDTNTGEGIGLTNMRERTELLGGNFELKSKSGLGTRIIFVFSLEPVVDTQYK